MMEPSTVLKTFMRSARQYRSNPVQENLLNLQRNLDIIIALTSHSDECKPFDSKALSECMTCFSEVLVFHHADSIMANQILGILQNFASDEAFLPTLKSSADWFSFLTLFLERHGDDVTDPIVCQCLKLLEVLTEDIKLSFLQSHMRKFITLLTVEITNKAVNIYVAALRILSNLCRRNSVVQHYIVDKCKMKNIFKSLIDTLGCPEETAIMYSLSILANLSTKYITCERLFTPKQMKDALEQIVINLISDDKHSSEAALRLFIDLLRVRLTMDFYLKYDKLKPALKRVIDSYDANKMDKEQSSRILNFLWSFVNSFQDKQSLIKMFTLNEEFHPILNDWIAVSGVSSDASLYALKIMHQLAENFCDTDWEFFEFYFQGLIPTLLKNISPKCKFSANITELKECFEAQNATCELLTVFATKEKLRSCILRNLNDILYFLTAISQQLHESNSTSKEKECYDSGSNLVVTIFCLVIELAPQLNIYIVEEMMKRASFLAFLAHNLNSKDNQCIQKTLIVISKMHHALSFTTLAECLINQVPEPSEEFKWDGIEEYISETHYSRTESVLKEVENIIYKVKNGLDIHLLDRSEVLTLLDFEINSLKIQEKSLLKVIEAKTKALEEADEVLNYYKLKHAKIDTEGLKLRRYLIKAESISEESRKFASEQHNRAQRLEELFADTSDKLKYTFVRINELEKTIASLSDKLERCSSELQITTEQFEEKLRDKDREIEGVIGQLGKTKGLLKSKNDECEELQTSREKLEKTIAEKDDTLKQINHDVKVLEMVRQRHESTIREKEAQLKSLSEELDKQKELTDMIHRISGGISK